MAQCKWCNQEMSGDYPADTCTGNTHVEFPDGASLPSLKYNDPKDRCCDCNIAPDGYHHPGCDMEKCPRCKCQLIGCECLDTGDE